MRGIRKYVVFKYNILNAIPIYFFERRQSPMAKLESKFQSELIRELKELFPGALVLKMDSSNIQGIPDLLVLFNNKWASLECKRYSSASKRPNQEYYVDLMNKMSFSRFISPENKEQVIHDLEQTFKS